MSEALEIGRTLKGRRFRALHGHRGPGGVGDDPEDISATTRPPAPPRSKLAMETPLPLCYSAHTPLEPSSVIGHWASVVEQTSLYGTPPPPPKTRAAAPVAAAFAPWSTAPPSPKFTENGRRSVTSLLVKLCFPKPLPPWPWRGAVRPAAYRPPAVWHKLGGGVAYKDHPPPPNGVGMLQPRGGVAPNDHRVKEGGGMGVYPNACGG